MKTTLNLGALALSMLLMTGCVGTKHVSDGITNAGHVPAQNIAFPPIEKAWQDQGIFPNSENLSKIKPGISKDELYELIGRPHFSESQYAREWDYIFKFYKSDDSVMVCQYKVIFDEEFKGQEFYLKPATCPPKAEPAPVPVPPVVIAPPIVVPPPAPVVETITLSADALFKFDKWSVADMLPQGRVELDELANKLSQYQRRGNSRIIITGHTDYLGADSYNMKLSLQRAQTVREYLINRGIDANSLVATGAGETQPVKECNSNQPRQQLIDCLQPNRRVEIGVSVTYTVPAPTLQ